MLSDTLFSDGDEDRQEEVIWRIVETRSGGDDPHVDVVLWPLPFPRSQPAENPVCAFRLRRGEGLTQRFPRGDRPTVRPAAVADHHACRTRQRLYKYTKTISTPHCVSSGWTKSSRTTSALITMTRYFISIFYTFLILIRDVSPRVHVINILNQ